MTSIINLVKSSSDIGQLPIKSARRHTICITKFSLIHNWDKVLHLGNAHKCQSLITLRANEKLNAVSSEDLANVSSDTINRSLKRSFMNSESAIQLKRTYPFTSMLENWKENDWCGQKTTRPQSAERDTDAESDVEMLLVDDNASEIHKEQNDAFGFEEVDVPVYDLDQSLVNLCEMNESL